MEYLSVARATSPKTLSLGSQRTEFFATIQRARRESLSLLFSNVKGAFGSVPEISSNLCSNNSSSIAKDKQLKRFLVFLLYLIDYERRSNSFLDQLVFAVGVLDSF